MKYLEISKNVMISDTAYKTIVLYSMTEVEGFCKSLNLTKNITSRVLNRYVSLNLTDDGVIVDAHISVCLGYNIEEVCKKIQENVYEVITNNIGFPPAEVNVTVFKVSSCD